MNQCKPSPRFPSSIRGAALLLASVLLAAGSPHGSGGTIDPDRIAPHPKFGRLVITAELTGDGKPEIVHVVRVLPRKAGSRLAGQVPVYNPWDAREQRIGDRGAQMALRITGSGKTWLLHSDYVRLSAEVMQGAPVEVAAKRSAVARGFRSECPGIRNDVLVMATPAGIDIALYWAKDRYAVCWPNEEP